MNIPQTDTTIEHRCEALTISEGAKLLPRRNVDNRLGELVGVSRALGRVRHRLAASQAGIVEGARHRAAEGHGRSVGMWPFQADGKAPRFE
jgi:hypothetical protein